MSIPSVYQLQRMPAGDRAPLLRFMAQHQRAALAALDDEPAGKVTSGRRTRRTRNLAKLRHIARAIDVEI